MTALEQAREALISRLLAHAAIHDAHTPHDDEQQQWADDLREAAAALSAQEVPQTDEVRHYAMRALIAWDGTVLPKAHDGMMQERMEDLRAALTAAPAAPKQVPQTEMRIDPMQDPMRPGYFMNYAENETPAEMVLRKLACWLGVGGYNAPTVDAEQFHRKIVDGVESLLRTAAPAAPKQAEAWQPIETAPKDGSEFLCWVSAVRYGETDEGQQYQQDVSQASFCNWRTQSDIPDCGWFDPCCGQIADQQAVTHWLPLPQAPAAPQD